MFCREEEKQVEVGFGGGGGGDAEYSTMGGTEKAYLKQLNTV